MLTGARPCSAPRSPPPDQCGGLLGFSHAFKPAGRASAGHLRRIPQIKAAVAIAIGMEHYFGAVVTCAMTGTLGAEAIARGIFDLAVIDTFLPDISGFELAESAANRFTPRPACHWRPRRQDQTPKARLLDDLAYQAALIMTHSDENIRRVKASAARLRATADGLQPFLVRSRHVLSNSKNPQAAPHQRHKIVR
jgi:CheY-like chemotaxis protein